MHLCDAAFIHCYTMTSFFVFVLFEFFFSSEFYSRCVIILHIHFVNHTYAALIESAFLFVLKIVRLLVTTVLQFQQKELKLKQ